MAQQRRVVFSGNVQGVGFRYTTKRLASQYPVTGWVRNLQNGTVEILAEGEPEVLDDFLGHLRGTMGDHIRDEQTQTAPASGQLSQFEIRY